VADEICCRAEVDGACVEEVDELVHPERYTRAVQTRPRGLAMTCEISA
jgi:hypothetical protein